MNFLSHYYLHKKNDNNYFNIGLTLPDVIGLHNKHVRLTEKHINNLISTDTSDNYLSLFEGMRLHFMVDRWFHKSDFFKRNIIFLQEEYLKASKKENIASYYSHILLEIIIDRYLLNKYPLIADDFYQNYQEFNFYNITDLFLGVKNFDTVKFLDFVRLFSYSDFLKRYNNNKEVINDLKRVTLRIGLPIKIETPEDTIADYIESSYITLEQSIEEMFTELKEIDFYY